MGEFLAIRNWEKRQPGRKGKSEWIKDYTDKDSDEDYEKLTFFQRQVLDGCRRLRGRLGKNPPNDPMYIARALHAGVTDRPHIGHAISTLLVRGLLILTNQQLDFVDKEIDKEVEKEKTVSDDPAPAKQPRKVKPIRPETSSGLKAVIILPLNSGDEYPIAEEDFGFWRESYPAVDVMQELRAMAAWCHANPTRRKTKTGVKAFVNRWLAKAQNNPTAAAHFKNGAGNGNGSTSKTGTAGRNNRNLEAIVSVAVGDSVRGDHVPDSGSVPHGVNSGVKREAGSFSDPEILAREPK